MIEIKSKFECCGCTACESICPKKCITMKKDFEGFKYPVVNKKQCTNCGLCKKVCPIVRYSKEIKFKQKAFVINIKNEKVRSESTAGGAFTGIAEYVIDKKGVVYGAAFDENYKVVHTYVENNDELYKFRNSKYVQSDLKNTFKEVKAFLEQDRYVCFSGVPCQIEGLKSYLQKEYENLITVDLMCHAVPSPLVWEKYLNYIKTKLHANKIINIIFRDKSKYGYKYSMMTIETDKGLYSEGIDTDPYLRAFFNNLSDRPSCYKCKFKKQYRVSDFTIWDCFIVEKFDKSLDDDRGTTRILIHSQKGVKIFEEMKNQFKYKETEVDKLVKNVKEMSYSVNHNYKRENFFKDINNIQESEFFRTYFPITMRVKCESFIRKFLAKTGMYKVVKLIAKKLLGR